MWFKSKGVTQREKKDDMWSMCLIIGRRTIKLYWFFRETCKIYFPSTQVNAFQRKGYSKTSIKGKRRHFIDVFYIPMKLYWFFRDIVKCVFLLHGKCYQRKGSQSFSELLLHYTDYVVKKLSLPECFYNLVFQKNTIYDTFSENYSYLNVVFTNLAQILCMGGEITVTDVNLIEAVLYARNK